ncbi:YkvA family protein [Pseudomonas sp. HR96]|uniref:YkvA family protein n=1 Tax=Pseudomonas sp. HR96 TaxID=1027966 RepID=UPI002A74DFF9|nr:YkvA family protein [Pseudomonas sp. HR96]WPO98933.1 YkvA family protein [Pseudomonas sp. HR96]
MKAPFSFGRFVPLAERLLSRGRLPALIFAVTRKSKHYRLGKLRDDVRLLQALCMAYWRGEYRAISAKSMVSIVAGLLYFVSPIDFIPDWILGVGMLDDIAVLSWVMKTLSTELDAFRAWRERQDPQHLQVVERLPRSGGELDLEQHR